MTYTEEFAKKVLDKTDITKVIGRYTKLEAKDGVYVGNCVFHKDKNQSLIVYPDKQVFHCLDCGTGGNAATFLMEKEGCKTLSDAIDRLAKDAGIKPEPKDIIKMNNSILKQNLYNVYRDAALFYNQKLRSPEGERALAYIKGRDTTDATIKAFGMGYAPSKGKSLYKYLKAKKYTDELMLTAGLIKISETGPYDVFRDRVMFPIMDAHGRVIAMNGRVINPEAKPKYLNSPETPIFNKSAAIYAIQKLPKVTPNKKLPAIVLVEGNYDALTAQQYGFNNVVATQGTAATPIQLDILSQYTDTIMIAYDTDDAGKKATNRLIGLAMDAGLNVRIVSTAPAKDTHEFLTDFGAKEFQYRLDRSSDPLSFQIQFLAQQYDLDNPDQKKEFGMRAAALMIRDSDKAQDHDTQEHTR